MEGKIIVEFFTGEKPLEFTVQTCYVVENIIIESCKYLNIGPLARNLFGLWCPSDELWLPPSKKIHLSTNKTWLFRLKIRFKVPSVKRLIEKTDAQTFNYYFHQVRTDFLEGKIPELLDKDTKVRERAFGLVATDILRLMLELKSTPDTMRYNSRDFLPKYLQRNRILENYLHKNLQGAVNRGWKNSRQNPEFVKENYFQLLFDLVPDYGSEHYSVLVDEGGKIYEVSLFVNPYHPEYPGLRMKIEKSKSSWTHICCIEELCYISMRNDGTVEISRQNGVPKYLKFYGKEQMHSFVSLLDGYYRLSEKWTFNLCKDLPTPSLLLLRSMKCHGPVGKAYAYQKLEKKSGNEIGCYILRESEAEYDVYFIDILFDPNIQSMDKIHTFKIYKDENDFFYMEDGLSRFPSIPQLIAHISKKIPISLSRCIPPSEYDVTSLFNNVKLGAVDLICRSITVFLQVCPFGKMEKLMFAFMHNMRPENTNLLCYLLCFYMEDGLSRFPSTPQLIVHISKKIPISLSRCIPPSEYDKTDLLLCRKENQNGNSMVSRGDCSCAAQCIPRDALLFSKSKVDLFGQITIVSHGQLRRSCSDYRAVAVKMLRKETKVTHLQEFLSQCDKVLFWNHDAIVSTIGMVLSNPTALIMEWFPLGSLDKYLQTHEKKLREVDLVEAAYHIARALWYLEELQAVHGKIRCRNILVTSHTDNSFKVKLADPGVIVYTDSDIHWIPPEYYNDYSQVAKSSASDVYAFGTTTWEIFSYGKKPLATLSPKEAKEWYQKGNSLHFPSGYHKEIKDVEKLILECWNVDPDNRKRPQAIVRDVNQLLYEAYNSRRTHSYATIDSSVVTPIIQEEITVKPPALPPSRPPKEQGFNILKSIKFKWQTPSTNNFEYNSLSQSSINTSGQSVFTIVTDIGRDSPVMSINGLDSICESETDPLPDPINVSSSDLSWVIDKEQLTIKGTLGQGFYGEVLKATLTHCSGLTSEEVAVKRIKMSNQPHEYFADLRREIEIMKNLRHKNIVEIKGLVEEPETMLVMEYLELGSLLAYLQLHRNKLSCSRLLKFAVDVAEGMAYLEQKHIVHRDLAARNILVASEKHVKISDFGLAQFTEDHYYRMRTQRNLPIRWYALESITEGKFSHKSDVWSYGITLWEMFSFGENPEIPGVPDAALNEALQQGHRLRMTEHCPALVYSLMRSCWEKDSHDRPSFTDIIQKLQVLHTELCS